MNDKFDKIKQLVMELAAEEKKEETNGFDKESFKQEILAEIRANSSSSTGAAESEGRSEEGDSDRGKEDRGRKESDNGNNEEDRDEEAQEDQESNQVEIDEKDLRIAKGELNSALTERGIDKKLIKGLDEFLLYAKLFDEKGSLASEKIESLADALSSLALRKPPANKSKTRDFSGGLGKYLDE